MKTIFIVLAMVLGLIGCTPYVSLGVQQPYPSCLYSPYETSYCDGTYVWVIGYYDNFGHWNAGHYAKGTITQPRRVYIDPSFGASSRNFNFRRR